MKIETSEEIKKRHHDEKMFLAQQIVPTQTPKFVIQIHKSPIPIQTPYSEADRCIELEELRKDRKRLEWLDTQRKDEGRRVFSDIKCQDTKIEHVGWSWILDSDFSDIRTAIDEAMKHQKP